MSDDRASADRLGVSFWGVRGTRPVPGRESVRYGGHTACVSLAFPTGQLFVLDAGTGMSGLSNWLERRTVPVRATVLVSHPHWDHISGLPFFTPLYAPDSEIEICSPRNAGVGAREVSSGQMDGVHFPVAFGEVPARVSFRELGEGDYVIAGISVRAMRLRHAGTCLGYRVTSGGRSVSYVTDNELFSAESPSYDQGFEERLTAFVRRSDMLVLDATYADDDYAAFVGRGHSSVGQAVGLAHAAEVDCLYLFHHDPAQTDDDVDRKLTSARGRLTALGSRTRCVAPAEGDVVFV